jgi:hypothetical protein
VVEAGESQFKASLSYRVRPLSPRKKKENYKKKRILMSRSLSYRCIYLYKYSFMWLSIKIAMVVQWIRKKPK